MKPYRPLLMGQVVVSIIWAVEFSLSPFLIKEIIDTITQGLNHSSTSKIGQLCLCYICLSSFMVLVFRFYDWVLMRLNSDFKRHIGITIIQKMLIHSHGFYQNKLVGSITNKINETIDHTVNILRLLVDHLLSHLLALAVAVITLWSCVGAKFSVGLITWIVIFFYASSRLLVKGKVLAYEAAEKKSHLVGKISDLFKNYASVHAFNAGKKELSHIGEEYNQSVAALQKRDWHFIKIYFIQKSSFVIFQGLCLWWLFKGLGQGTVTAGDFALILIINNSIVKCLWNISRDLREFTESAGAVLMGLEMIDQPILVKYKNNDVENQNTEGRIDFENVTFGFHNNKPLFKEMNVSFKPKEKIGIVGYSGSGKTTFIKLLLRTNDVQEGRILIDKCDIRKMSKPTLTQAISIVSQNFSLFNRTIKDNIQFGNENLSYEDIQNVIRIVDLEDFIDTLPYKYDTFVGEDGVTLSGGQKQRILLARAILKKAPIFILDEATSQLDTITDNKIFTNIQNLMNDSTTIIVTHRLTTLMQMDRILVFNKGNIVQDGRHEDLIQINGLYLKLWSSSQNDILLI